MFRGYGSATKQVKLGVPVAFGGAKDNLLLKGY